jgi:hypothetical protein
LVNGNGVLAKLAGMRQRFMAEFQGEAARFRLNVQALREKYLNEIVELTMTDPNVAAVQNALDFFRDSTEQVVVVPPTGPASTVPAVPIEVPPADAVTLAPPDKQPLKKSRTAVKMPLKSYRPVYGSCPNCNSPIWEPQAKFCSQCAYPFGED